MSRKRPAPEPSVTRALGRPLTVGECVPAAYSAWARNALAFGVVSAVYQAPVSLFIRWAAPIKMSEWGSVARAIAAILLPILAGNLTLGAVTFGVLENRNGRRPSIGRCLGVSFRTVGTLFGISFRMVVQVFLWAGLGGFVGALVATLASFGHPERMGTSATSMILLFAPIGIAMLWYFARYATSGPVAVVEHLDHWYSMDRSRRLSEGRRLAVAATLFLVVAPAMALSAGVSVIGGINFGVETPSVWNWIATGIDVLVGGPLAGVAVATVYHALRRERDGVDAEELGKVFE